MPHAPRRGLTQGRRHRLWDGTAVRDQKQQQSRPPPSRQFEALAPPLLPALSLRLLHFAARTCHSLFPQCRVTSLCCTRHGGVSAPRRGARLCLHGLHGGSQPVGLAGGCARSLLRFVVVAERCASPPCRAARETARTRTTIRPAALRCAAKVRATAGVAMCRAKQRQG